MKKMMLFSGNANRPLAEKIAQKLEMPLGKANISRFSDGEILVEIQENVRGSEVFLIQSTCAPSNAHLMELMIMTDALRRASAGLITAVIPYFGYARQDRRPHSARVPITAKVIADMLTTVGIDRVVTVDLHADQIQGFFSIPVDNVYGNIVMVNDIKSLQLKELIVVSPDVGGVVRARALAKLLNDSDLAIIDKRRPAPNQTQVMNLIGEVKERHCIILDDIVDTAGTLCTAASVLKGYGALSVRAYCTHPVLSGNAIQNIEQSNLDELVVTDTISLKDNALTCNKIRQLSMSQILAQTIHRIYEGESVSSMFN